MTKEYTSREAIAYIEQQLGIKIKPHHFYRWSSGGKIDCRKMRSKSIDGKYRFAFDNIAKFITRYGKHLQGYTLPEVQGILLDKYEISKDYSYQFTKPYLSGEKLYGYSKRITRARYIDLINDIDALMKSRGIQDSIEPAEHVTKLFERLKKIRDRRYNHYLEATQRTIAQRIGIHESAMTHMSRGHWDMSQEIYNQISTILDELDDNIL